MHHAGRERALARDIADTKWRREREGAKAPAYPHFYTTLSELIHGFAASLPRILDGQEDFLKAHCSGTSRQRRLKSPLISPLFPGV